MAPIGKNPQRILDVGTGTGIWALDAAETWPSAEVIGTDVSPIQPGWTFPNCKFELDDCELDWTFPRNHFDFIHSRTMLGSLHDWPRYLKQMFNHCKPGGYVELVEIEGEIFSDDDTLKPGSGIDVFIKNWHKALDISGLTHMYWTSNKLETFLKEAGFEDLRVYLRKQPIGPWPKDPKLKEIGKYLLLSTESIYASYGLALFTRVLGMPQEEASKICDGASRDSVNPKIHMYNNIWFIVARKPSE